MKQDVFTDEALKEAEKEAKKFLEELKSDAVNEALRNRGEPIEVTANDVKKARNKFVKKGNTLLPRTEFILKVYKVLGIISIVFGIMYISWEYIDKFLLRADERTKLGMSAIIFGIVLSIFSYLLGPYINYLISGRSRRKAYNIDIKDELDKINDLKELDKIRHKGKANEGDNKLDLLGKISPKSLVLESWIMIEESISKIIVRNSSNIDKILVNSPLKMIEYLLNNNYIDSDMFKKLNTMRLLRNEIVHSSKDAEISFQDAKEYQHLAESLRNNLYELNPLKKLYVICTDNNNSIIYKDIINTWNDNENLAKIIYCPMELISATESQIQAIIKKNIKEADIILCIVNGNINNKFSRLEIEFAINLNKKIIAVKTDDSVKIHPLLEEVNIKWIDALSKESLINSMNTD